MQETYKRQAPFNPSPAPKLLKLAPSISADGRSLFTNRLHGVCPKSSYELTLMQLMYKRLDETSTGEMCESALLMTYSYDLETLTLLASLPAKVTIVLNRPYRPREDARNVTILTPKLQPGQKFHSKLYLMKFRDRLRVVITSANLTVGDWEEILQGIWLQDFEVGQGDFRFGAELAWFLSEVMGEMGFDLETELGITLSDYNFEGAEGHLVTSVPGIDMHPEVCGLGRMREILHGCTYTQFIYQASSIGSLSHKSLTAYRLSFTNNPKSTVSVMYPSQDLVERSNHGIPGAGQFYLRPDSIPPSLVLTELNTLHPGYLSHSKVMLIWNGEVTDETALYLGSHNLTVSAWGPHIQNYEIGIVLGPKMHSAEWKRHAITHLPVQLIDCTASTFPPFYQTY